MNLGDAAILSLIGIAIVFVVLMVLMLIIYLMGYVAQKSGAVVGKIKKAEESAEIAVAEQSEPLAEGTCGDLLLVKTEERDAAMIMAIVADETQTPLNELRFKSIKRID